ncbi:MAG: methyltransferase domain-containing protein [Bryobacteraceae bacterium]|jgi:SAM-dependent methyltransferase
MDMTRRAVVPLLLTPLRLRGQTNAGDREWAAFLGWVKALPPGALPSTSVEPFAGYQKKLIADGVSPKDAEALTARLQTRSAHSPEWMTVRLNWEYSQEDFHREKPDAFLVETASALRPGKALDLGMGEGRNAIYLAQHGWDVTGLDVSDVGVAHAKEKSRKLGVRIDARVQDVYLFDFGASQWDLVCLLYFSIHDHEGTFQQIARGLKPGGHVIVETPVIPVMESLLQAREKWEATKLHLLRMEYLEGWSEWGQRQIPLGRLLLQKPA